MNGIYDSVIILVVFPLIIAIGASEKTAGGTESNALARWLGGISYPLYITHYALIYLYTEYVLRDHWPPAKGAAWGAVLFVSAVAIAYACLKLYDEPVRAWLSRRYLHTRTATGSEATS